MRLTHRAGTRPRRGPKRRYSSLTGRCGMKARITAVSVMVGVCGVSGAASGQNALDRNLQVGSGGVNTPTRPDFNTEVRMRNAIITGNAPGGVSFRGDVGYRAPGEFLGRLGT